MNYAGNKFFMLPTLKHFFYDVRDYYKIDHFYDLFGGGGNVSINVDFKYVHYNEINTNLVDMFQEIIKQGPDIIPDIVLRDTFYEVRNNKNKYPGWYTYAIDYIASFRGNIAGVKRGYTFKSDDDITEEYIRQSKRRKQSAVETALALKNCIITNKDYRDVEIVDGSIVYMDPPYKSSRWVKYEVDFDYDAFYEYCYKLSRNNVVIISEYDMPIGFKEIASVSHHQTFSRNSGEKHWDTVNDEKVWVVSDGFGLDVLLNKIGGVLDI